MQNQSMFTELVAHGADVNAKDNNGDTPLITACETNELELVKDLLQSGADPNLADTYGVTPLIAASSQSPEFTKVLLENKADVNKLEANKVQTTSALIAAAMSGKYSNAETLIAHGANVNIPNVGESALSYAVERNDASMVTLLLSHGADVNFKNGDGKTLLMLNTTGDPGNTYGIRSLLKAAGEKL
jgi:hypothetical protein